MEFINSLWIQFNAFAEANQIVAGVVSLWGLSVVTFVFRSIPHKLMNIVVSQSTTTLTLNSQDNVYHDFMNWISKNKFHSFVRSLHFNNNKWGYGKSCLSIGYGRTYFFYKYKLFIMTKQEIEANQTDRVKEKITVRVIGRDHNIFKELFEEVSVKDDDDKNYLKICRACKLGNTFWFCQIQLY